jgi:hypothetical protein
VAASGEVIGRHEGIHNFTVGQRKGLGVAVSPSPLYVLNIDPASHRVTVGADAELATRTLRARQLNWISIAELTGRCGCGEDPAPARAGVGSTLEPMSRSARRGAVFYDGDEWWAGAGSSRASEATYRSMSRSARCATTPGPVENWRMGVSTTATKWWAAAGCTRSGLRITAGTRCLREGSGFCPGASAGTRFNHTRTRRRNNEM